MLCILRLIIDDLQLDLIFSVLGFFSSCRSLTTPLVVSISNGVPMMRALSTSYLDPAFVDICTIIDVIQRRSESDGLCFFRRAYVALNLQFTTSVQAVSSLLLAPRRV
ncbi:hypothetical protein ARMGADRAFT_423547 [Armillaria gallica]|uniref:Uncharacterized protein n=1 Tax=Armillaria gallica TaxID=47427 RepID=A0A2H3E1R2_ARMGA|nr:hypothetical protein ARMGADRAFT_423547 [Armillaria gallica]